jgi:hypothetical protein
VGCQVVNDVMVLNSLALYCYFDVFHRWRGREYAFVLREHNCRYQGAKKIEKIEKKKKKKKRKKGKIKKTFESTTLQ